MLSKVVRMNRIKRIFDLLCQYYKEYGVIGLLIHLYEKLKWFLFKRKFKKIGKNTFVESPFVIRGEKYMTVGNNFNARKRLQLEAFDTHNGVCFHPQIIIGDRVSINYDVHIGAINKIIIEDDVLIASKVFIADHSHGKIEAACLEIPPQKRILYSKGPVHIKQRTWIGEGVVIMPNVTIGENCIIGANSVVTKDVPDNCVVAGNPATLLKRF